MASPRRLLMVVPYKARDLEGAALLGYHLQTRYGHEVIYSNGYSIEKKLLQYGPDAIILDHLSWRFKVDQARMARELGMKVIVLPTEGLFQDKDNAVRRAGKYHDAGPLVDLYLSWGDYPRDAILEQGLMTEDQIHRVGSPRFDLYRKPYTRLLEDRAAFLGRLGVTNPEAPAILWATNTAYASRNQKKIFKRHVVRGKKSAEEMRIMLQDQTIQFREHSSVVVELARRNPDWNFIIKVHPAEWVNPYLKMVEETRNLHLAFDAPIRDFLHHCEVLLQRNCTTATEAWMLEKPVLSLEIGEYLRPVREEYRSGNHLVFNTDEAGDAIRSYLDGAEIPASQREARERFIYDFFYKVDGKSSERAAELINSTVSAPAYTDEDQRRTRSRMAEETRRKTDFEDARLINRIKDLFGIDRGMSLRFWKTMFTREAKANAGLFTAEVEITPEMVEELYDRYASVTAHAAAGAK